MTSQSLPPGTVTDPSLIETVDVRFAGADGQEIGGYLATPTGATASRPAIIVIHEAFGLNDHLRDVAWRFANRGYTALAVDLYSREGAPDASDISDVLGKMFAVPDSRAVGDLEGAARFLRERDDATGEVACIGFCSGGRQTLLFAARSSALDVAIYCWGGFVTHANFDGDKTTPQRPVPIVDLVADVSCPLYLAVGEDDDNPAPDDVALVAERAREAGVEVRFTRYPGAGHAFFADYRDSYEPESAARLWDEIHVFLDTHLSRLHGS